MKWVRCEQCGGEYLPVQADGSLYQHVCPPPRPAPAARPGLWRRWYERVTGKARRNSYG